MHLNIYGTKRLSALNKDSDTNDIDIGAMVDLRKVSLQKRINFSTNSTEFSITLFWSNEGVQLRDRGERNVPPNKKCHWLFLPAGIFSGFWPETDLNLVDCYVDNVLIFLSTGHNQPTARRLGLSYRQKQQQQHDNDQLNSNNTDFSGSKTKQLCWYFLK